MTNTRSTTDEQHTNIGTKVAKLLRQAEDRRGTPEGAVFEAKAFELMAKYGVEASQEDDTRRARRRDVDFAGSYTDLQFRLFTSIASTLHCTPIRYHRYNKRTVEHAVLFGLNHHVERIMMLYSILNPQMIAGANRYGDSLWSDAGHTRKAKRSWMLGFIETIRDRLATIENKHQQNFARAGKTGELVLLNDAEEAMRLAREEFPFLQTNTQRSPTSVDPAGFTRGIRSGENMDLGQTRMPRLAHALPPGA